MLQRELSQQPELFGSCSRARPTIRRSRKESVHHFSKIVAGAPLKRPQWFFDVRQQGEGIVDVTTHLVDLVQWEAFPGTDAEAERREGAERAPLDDADHAGAVQKVTGAKQFPEFLQRDVKDGVLQRLLERRVHLHAARRARAGVGDVGFRGAAGQRRHALLRHARHEGEPRHPQGAEQKYKPVLYIERAAVRDAGRARGRGQQGRRASPGRSSPASPCAARAIAGPSRCRSDTTSATKRTSRRSRENFLRYLRAGKLPEWEVPNMLAKYATIMQAYRLSR